CGHLANRGRAPRKRFCKRESFKKRLRGSARASLGDRGTPAVTDAEESPGGFPPGPLALTTGRSLTADLEAGSAARAASLGARDVAAGDELDPKRTVALVVRGVADCAQRIEAVHGRARGGGRETRQLEDHPRAGVQLR